MSDHDHVQACAQARLNGLKQFFMARGHGADEADDLAKRHLRGETVHINPPGPEVVDAEIVEANNEQAG